MKLSRKFVTDYIDLDESLSIKDIADAMTNVGNEYDYASKLINCTNLIVGEILECENHPDSDHLHVCKVDIGNEVLDIVCGAPNCRKGLKVIVAQVGAKLPGGEIKSGMIRGQLSNGMLCSLAELGLENKFLSEKDINGICELPLSAVNGSDPIKLLGFDDEVIDFELTSNRGDLLSVLGMAYELGAIYKKDVKAVDLKYNQTNDDINDTFKIDVQTADCSLFLAKKVQNVEIKESPEFIKNRLIASGIRPINNVVDISNYVMLELGQPLHYYDASLLGNQIIVRNATEGEKLVTLDDNERILTASDLVIANPNEAVGLAGVMGGASTEVNNNTKDIIIESAIFDSIKIRKTSKRILRSEASNRFEKGLDPKRTYMAIERSCALLEKYANATVVGGLVKYDKTNISARIIEIEPTKISRVLGINIELDKIISIFESLGFKVENTGNLKVTVPTRRMDINIAEDLIEEVGRMYGMDNIKGKLPVLNVITGSYNKTNRKIKNKLVDMGLNETLSYTLIPNNNVFDFTNDSFDPITLNDPMSEDRSTLRYSLLYSLMDVYKYNKSHDIEDISIFEIGKGFYCENEVYKEEKKLAVLMSGNYYLDISKTKVDFYIIKGILEELLDYLGYNGRYTLIKTDIPKEFHPGQSAVINLQGKNIGVIGKLHPNVANDVYAFEINLDKLLDNRVAKMTYKDISKFPMTRKDLAFVMDKSIPSSEIEDAIKKAAGKILKSISIFDVYTGNNLKENEKSIAYNLVFSDLNKTLTDEEINALLDKIISYVEVKTTAKLRSN